MRDPMKNFWRQPSKGFTPETAGRSNEQLAQWEKGCGFTLPALYKAHMRQQNGGLPWPQAYFHEDIEECLFINSGEYAAIPEDGSFLSPADVYGEEELKEVFGQDAKLERLYVLSWIYGHNVLCLDYGYNLDMPRQEPEVCYFETDGFKELFRVDSYETFIERLVYSTYCYEGRWHIGIRTELSQDALAEHFSKVLSTPMRKHEDDRYGWFNFTSWYSAIIVHKDRGRLGCALSPNRFKAGTWLFPDSQDYPFILEIDLDDESAEDAKDSRAFLEGMMRALRADAVEVTFLMPE